MFQEKYRSVNSPKHIDKNIRSEYNMRHKKEIKSKMPPIQTMLVTSLGGKNTYNVLYFHITLSLLSHF